MKSLKEQFVDWVKQQPTDEEYDYWDSRKCACGRFCESTGLDWLGDDAANNARCRIEPDLRLHLIAWPWSFGALAQRLEATRHG